MMMVAGVLKQKKTNSMVEFAVAPGSRQVLNMLAKNGAIADIIAGGARILEAACGPCIGQGYSPANDVVSVRTFNRNFPARSGTTPDFVYLVSPETAVAAALAGEFVDPRELAKQGVKYPRPDMPAEFFIDDTMIEQPLTEAKAKTAEVLRGPTIVVPEAAKELPASLSGQVLLKCGDKVTTDHIMPAGTFLKYRSNVPEYSKYVFNCFNEKGKPTFAQRAMELKSQGIGGVIVAGESYGQGSSREHAALCPMYLGVRVVLAKSIERIHKANLINFAIVPIQFAEAADFEKINLDDGLEIDSLLKTIENRSEITIKNKTKGYAFAGTLLLSQRDRDILLAGGLLNYTRKCSKK
jgi:aconitate hydratase